MVEEASVKISFYRFQCGSTFKAFHHKPGTIRSFLKTPPFFEVWYGAQVVGASASHKISHMHRRYAVLSHATWTDVTDGDQESEGSGSLRSKRSRTKRTKFGPRKGVFHIRTARKMEREQRGEVNA